MNAVSRWLLPPLVALLAAFLREQTVSAILARLVGRGLSERLRQSFAIDNRPGANTNIAIETVAKATPDDSMLGVVGTGAAINAALYEHLGCDLARGWRIRQGVL
jgi:Tripartite tricarboxylate transporter family receptor